MPAPRPRYLRLTGSTVLDATGAGQVDVYPAGGDLVVTKTTVTVTTDVAEPTANIYRGGTTATNLIEGTYSGSNDSTDARYVVPMGQAVSAIWAGGDAAATATLLVEGALFPPGEAPLL